MKAVVQVQAMLLPHSATLSHKWWNTSLKSEWNYGFNSWQVTGCIERAVQTNKHSVKQPAVLPHICLTIFHFKVSVWGWSLPTVTSQDEINLEKINTSVESSCESWSLISILGLSWKTGQVTTVWPWDVDQGHTAFSVMWYLSCWQAFL